MKAQTVHRRHRHFLSLKSGKCPCKQDERILVVGVHVLDDGYCRISKRVRLSAAVFRSRLKVVLFEADLSHEHEIERLLAKVYEQAGALDVLVNNAGLGDSVLFDRLDWARTRQVLRTNISAVAQLTSALVPDMVERSRGGVLNIGSDAGLTVLPNAAAYVGSKHFVAGFSEALRADLSGTGVTVTQVCPGPVESEFDQVAGSPIPIELAKPYGPSRRDGQTTLDVFRSEIGV